MNIKNYIRIAAVIYTIVGAINWGLVGLAQFDLVAYLFGGAPTACRIIYCIVGLSGLYMLSLIKKLL